MCGLYVDYIIRSHEPKSHVAPYCDHLDAKNAVVTLMMLFGLCNANSRNSGMT